ncbi:transglutaminase family protein [Desulfuromonas acetoxidans]|uniref:Lipoprotein, putative n=1 Tax=Desulfuromonas acetoxidans (strain DSM 684 / 11070) TaxID=281689 RepID=Q1JYG2_DESA6|nr:transglutaminase family protein [Desulfuromonas acetoxidans]EAT15244.1 lipoprotein, putative [Desulfuromonas acetoxidans DSM 684]MBF0645370.1 transglutaminase family protein [Desulfuromonas acetoxidans]NVD23450.1 transglutaminase family protein [Desulfuromonas acetoxidans]NVE15311.1 transglutaminase family protein [Desulfuromonas acetoxidans]
MEAYLAQSDIINHHHPAIQAKAAALRIDNDNEQTAKNCFEFVRDTIKHSWDYRLGPVTCIASDVLEHGTGYCYAKSHLLVALLRANAIPAALCYQRLILDETQQPVSFCLHGLTAVWLDHDGWYRIDPRGNKPGVDAQFCPPVEQLAFPTVTGGEYDLPQRHAEPLPEVVKVLTRYRTVEEVYHNLPDITQTGC